MIQVLKASAGSGKTFHLAKEYISLLLTADSPEAYRHILAVTFTNKATGEMKQRILKELDILARNPAQSDYYGDFVPGIFPNAAALSTAARKRLAALLHDYSAFAVSTIDRFFQQTLKAFSREIGHFASYQIELDRKAIIHESVDRVLDGLTDDGTDNSLLGWLTESVLRDLQEGKRFNMDRQLYSIAESLLSEPYRAVVQAAGIDEEKSLGRKHLKEVMRGCKSVVEDFQKSVQGLAQQILDLLKEHYGFEADCLGTSTKVIATLAQEPKDGVVKVPAKGFFDVVGTPEKWLKKAFIKKAPDIDRVIEEPLKQLASLFDLPFRTYQTALTLRKQLFSLGVAAELRKEFAALQQEKNILSLDESTTLLRDIIDGSDAPFIYEKTGVRYEHFLLDEFQDTSLVQWSNFLPLLENSNAGNFQNLIVGDVKQSIYRWRGSDWRLLEEGVGREFHLDDKDITRLRQNWRTFPVIVDTNNRFFLFAAAELDRLEQNRQWSISRIYRDVWQIPMKGEPDSGCVETVFCPDDDAQMAETIRAVEQYHELGWDYGDITILTRVNLDGAAVAKQLIERDIPVISDDALFVKSSVTVRRLVSQLSLINTPGNAQKEDDRETVSGYMASQMHLSAWQENDSYHSLVDLAEEILRELRSYDPETFEAEVPYIQAFMDYLQERVAIDGNDLPSFLQYWKEADPKIAPPEAGHSVRILSIHKAKGLEFPCVIIPFIDGINLYRSESQWCVPKTEGTALEGIADGAYLVNLSSKSGDTLFGEQYEEERHLQLIDNLNLLYVAMTRPKCNLRVIGALKEISLPEDFTLEAFENGPGDNWPEGLEMEAPRAKWSRVAELLYAYSEHSGMELLQNDEEYLRYRIGTPVTADQLKADEKEPVTPIPSRYPSYPLNAEEDQLLDEDGEPIPIGERNRLKFSAEAADFFGDDGSVGFEASPRVMGTVLHDLLAQVIYPETDLAPAIRDAVRSGLLPESRSEEIARLLQERLDAIRLQQPDWFPSPESGSRILNETSLLSKEGEIYRPDRMVLSPDGRRVTIIDYKFGKRNPGAAEADRELRKYLRQIGRYAALMREMGYPEVDAYLWYPLAAPEEAVITLRPPQA